MTNTNDPTFRFSILIAPIMVILLEIFDPLVLETWETTAACCWDPTIPCLAVSAETVALACVRALILMDLQVDPKIQGTQTTSHRGAVLLLVGQESLTLIINGFPTT
jgi:hypothetical protein